MVEYGRRIWSPSLEPQARARGKTFKKECLETFSAPRRPQSGQGTQSQPGIPNCPSHFGGLSGCRRVCRHRSLRKSQTILVENLFGISQWDTFPRHLGSSLRNARTRAIKVGIPRVDRGNHRKIEPRTNPHRWENRQGFL